MKKVYISVCIIITILLVGCNSKIVSTEDTNVFDKIKSELELIPKNYSADNAIKDGCFVILNQEVKSELEIRILHEKIDHLIMHQEQSMIEIQRVQMDMMKEILDQLPDKK